MAKHLMEIAQSGGFIITVIVDGDKRPDCKRDSWNRIKKREIDDISRVHCRMKAMKLHSKIINNTATEEERKDYESYNKQAKTLETCFSKSKFKIPSNFHEILSEKLISLGACNPNENGGYVCENILKAMFQADSVIARRCIQGSNDFIYSKDSDFPVLIGSRCILITNIYKSKVKAKRGRPKKRKCGDIDGNSNGNPSTQLIVTDASMFDVEISGSSNHRMDELRSYLENNSNKDSNTNRHITWQSAKYPLFDYSNPILRATIAIAMGSDIYKSGIKGIGVSTLSSIIAKLQPDPTTMLDEDSFIPVIKKTILNKTKICEIDYDTLVYAYLYEPGVVLNDCGIGGSNKIILPIDTEKEIVSSVYPALME